jgi:hypothetical protein
MDIDHVIRKLNGRYDAICIARAKKEWYWLIGFVAIGLAWLIPKDIRKDLMEFLGNNVKGMEYLKFKLEQPKMIREFREEEFFVVWRVSHAREPI